MSDLDSLFFYFICFGVSAALFHIGSKRKLRWLIILAILIPAIVGGLRYRVGVDYVSYMGKLKEAPEMGMAEFSSKFGGMEPALWLFGQLPWQFFFFATSFLTILFFYLGFKNFGSKHIGLCMLLVMLVIFPQALGGVRQGVAMSICFYAFSFIPQKRRTAFIVTVLCAALFHYSSLIMLLIYPLHYLMVSKPETEKKFIVKMAVMAVALVAAIVIGFQIIEYIPFLRKYALYSTAEFADQYGALTATHNILPELAAVALIVMFYGHLVKDKKGNGRFMFMSIILMMVITLIGFKVPLASRLADYFIAFFILAITSAIDTFSDSGSRRIMVGVVIAYAVLFFIGGIYLNGSGAIFPYRTLFELVEA